MFLPGVHVVFDGTLQIVWLPFSHLLIGLFCQISCSQPSSYSKRCSNWAFELQLTRINPFECTNWVTLLLINHLKEKSPLQSCVYFPYFQSSNWSPGRFHFQSVLSRQYFKNVTQLRHVLDSHPVLGQGKRLRTQNWGLENKIIHKSYKQKMNSDLFLHVLFFISLTIQFLKKCNL